MRKYVMFEKSTGKILKYGQCSHRDFRVGQGLKEGQDVIKPDKLYRDMDVRFRVRDKKLEERAL